MRRIIAVFIIVSVAFSCNSGGKRTAGKPGVRGEIIPKKAATRWKPETPHGMVRVPSGAFVMGLADQDFTYNPTRVPQRTVTVQSFFMDETEITNAEYRFFVSWVRDSIVRLKLAEKAGDGGTDGDGEAITDYAFKVKKNTEDKTPYDEFIESQGGRNSVDGEYDYSKRLDWNVPLYWNTSDYPTVEYSEILEDMYYKPEERFNDKRILDPRKLVYSFRWYDKMEAVKNRGRGDKFLKKEKIAIYPDTTVWLRDFNYSYNDPMFEQYFWHPSFEEYPVVGVKWDQARAYCSFKTNLKNDYNTTQKKKKPEVMSFRLPTEAEWEFAARGGLENATYPWGGPQLMDDRGCYLANFKPKRGDYIESLDKGYLYTAKVKSFHKNGFGLYDMAGNVSEWTDAPFENSAYAISSTMNPYLGNKFNQPMKAIRGGSWKDVGYLLMTGARDSEHKDSARSFIGFRTVQSLPESAYNKYRRTK